MKMELTLFVLGVGRNAFASNEQTRSNQTLHQVVSAFDVVVVLQMSMQMSMQMLLVALVGSIHRSVP